MALHKDARLTLFLDTAEALKGLDNFSRKFDSVFSTLGQVAGAVLGIKGITGVYNNLQKIVHTSERWNLPVEKVSQFANAFSLFGGTTEEAVDTIEKFQQLANNLKFHSNGALRDLSGILYTNLNKKNYAGLVQALRNQFGSLDADAQQEIMKMLGNDNLALLRMLRASDSEFTAMMGEAEQMGTVSAGLAESLRGIEIALARLKGSFQAFVAPILEQLRPLIDGFAKFVNWLSKLNASTKLFITSFAVLLPALKMLVGVFKGLSLTSLAGLATNPLAWIAVAAAGALVLAANWDKVVDSFNKYMEMHPRLAENLKTLGTVLNGIATALTAIVQSVQWAGEKLGSAIGWALGQQRESKADKFAREARFRSGSYTMEDLDAEGDAATREYRLGDITQSEYQERIKRRQQLLRQYAMSHNDERSLAYREAMQGMPAPDYIQPTSTATTAQSTVNNNNTTNNNDNGVRAQTINIYGVQGADDLMSRLTNLPRNNMTAVKGF